jgi:hypothetical protein
MTCLATIRKSKLYSKTSVDDKLEHNPKLLSEAAARLAKLQAIVKAKQSSAT